MTELKPITKANFWDVIALAGTARQERARYCAPNAVSLAQTAVETGLRPFAICDGGTPVGFIMYCIDEEDDEWWLCRLMVDKRHQRKGHARHALEAVLAEVKRDTARHRMYLGVEPESTAAVALYQSLGFGFNGQIFDKEHIMVLNW